MDVTDDGLFKCWLFFISLTGSVVVGHSEVTNATERRKGPGSRELKYLEGDYAYCYPPAG